MADVKIVQLPVATAVNDSDIVILENTLLTQKATVSQIKEKILNEVNTEISDINTNIDTIESDIVEINTDIDTINTQITDINGDINTISTDIEGIDNTLTTMETDISGIHIDLNKKTTYIDKGTATGIYTQTNTDFVGLIDLPSIKGIATQTSSLLGKNLFDKGRISSTKYVQPVTGTITNSNFSNNVSPYIQVVAGSSYTISGHAYVQPNTPVGLTWYTGTGVFVSGQTYQNTTGNGTYTAPATAVYLRYTINTVDLNTSQLELGSTATVYASFVPTSPTGNYPNTITNSGETTFDFINSGKNILPITSKTVTTTNGVTFTPNVDGSVTVNGTASAQADFYLFGAFAGTTEFLKLDATSYCLKGTGNSSCRINIGSTNLTLLTGNGSDGIGTFTDVKSIVFAMIRVDSGAVLNNLIVYPQLEVGTVSTAYETYKSNKITLSGLKLNYISPTIYDCIVKVSDTSYKNIQKVNKVILNGTQTVTTYTSIDSMLARAQVTIATYVNSSSTTRTLNAISNRFKFTSNISTTTQDTFSVGENQGWGGVRAIITIPKVELSSQDTAGVNAWITAHPITIYYELATPLETILTQRFYLNSYVGINNTSSTSSPKVTFTANAKSELWLNEYLIKDNVVTLQNGKIDKTEKGIANGVATLDVTGKVPSAQLPTIVSDAGQITYDNVISGLSSTNVKGAIDELKDGIDNIGEIALPDNASLFGTSGGLGSATPTDSERLQGHSASYFEGLVDDSIAEFQDSIGDVSDRVTVVESNYVQLSNPNFVINPDFQVWQRGISITAHSSGVYTADRWQANTAVVDGVNFYKSDDGMVVQTVPGNNSAGITQLIEDGYKLHNKVVTMSASVNGVVYSHTFTLPTGASAQYDVSPTISFAVSTIVANKCAGIQVLIKEANATNTINWIKLELGSISTPFVPRLYAEEISLCQRYFQPLIYAQQDPGFLIYRAGTTIATCNYNLQTRMRIAPTLIKYGTATTDGRLVCYNAIGTLLPILTANVVIYTGNDLRIILNFTLSSSSWSGTEIFIEFDTAGYDRALWLDAEIY